MTLKTLESNELSRIYNFLLRNQNAFTPPLQTRMNVLNRSKQLAELAANIFLCDTTNQHDIGHAAYYTKEQGIIYLTSFCIEEKSHGIGHGKILLNNIIYHGIQTGATHIELEVFKSNTNAKEFYLRHGFKPTKENTSKILMSIKI